MFLTLSVENRKNYTKPHPYIAQFNICFYIFPLLNEPLVSSWVEWIELKNIIGWCLMMNSLFPLGSWWIKKIWYFHSHISVKVIVICEAIYFDCRPPLVFVSRNLNANWYITNIFQPDPVSFHQKLNKTDV